MMAATDRVLLGGARGLVGEERIGTGIKTGEKTGKGLR